MNDYLISIIVPIYNTSKYLHDSIESLVNQTIFSKLEIILIDDGSTDDSLLICQEYSNKYKNIKTVVQKNNGVSSARNLGLENTSGEYIAFFDSDDLAESILYESLLDLCKKYDADVSIGDFCRIFPNGNKKKYRKNLIRVWNDKEEAIKSFLSGDLIGNNLVDKLFKKEVIRDIKFPSGFAIGEDMFFVYKALKNSTKVVLNSNICHYQYILRKSSAMNGDFSDKYLDTVNLSEAILEDIVSYSPLVPYAEAHLIHEKIKVLEYMMKNNASKGYDKYRMKYTKDIRKYSIVKGVKYLSKRQFYGLILMKISPFFYMHVHKIMKIG